MQPSSQSFEFDTCAGSGCTSALRLRLPTDVKDGIYVIEISDAIEFPCRLSANDFSIAADATITDTVAKAALDSEEVNEVGIENEQKELAPQVVEKPTMKLPTEIAGMVSTVHELQSCRELKIKVERNVVV